jgi:hypothetical protein
VQMFHMRQRGGAAVWRAQTQVLLGSGRLKYALPGWEDAESLYRGGKTLNRAVQRTRRRRPVGGHTPGSGAGNGGGLGGGGWGAGYGGDVGRVDRQ